MPLSFEESFVNVAWQALTTEHAALAISSPLARRYPAEIAPIAALNHLSADALGELRELMLPGEELFVLWSEDAGEKLPNCAGIEVFSDLIALQMIYPARKELRKSAAQSGAPGIEALTAANAAEMVALTDIAFPGFFRPQTYRMGGYWGIRSEGKLVAMVGERLALPGLREVSAVCTHPEHRGHGYATSLIQRVLDEHAAANLRSSLHVTDSNHTAIALYERLGFVKVGATRYNRIRRIPIAVE